MTASTRRPRRLPTAVTLVLSALVGTAACSSESAMPLPYCEQEGSGLIVAQSVPTADLVPCFDTLPAGWEPSSVVIDQDGTHITLDSDRAGVGAAELRYRERCEVGDAVTVPSDHRGAQQFELIESIEPDFSAQRHYRFPGGCLSWDFDFGGEAESALSIELGGRVMLISRESINEILRETFIDEEL